MLSPADHHRLVSRDLGENLRQRAALERAARTDPALRRDLARMCRDDVVFWINLFAWQHDPSKHGAMATGPFILFPRQQDLITARPETHPHLAPYDRGILWCLEHDKTMACEKSRWQGASWLFLIVMAWHCGFHEYRDWICVSRNEDAVDDGTKKSLFWKLRYVIDNQPPWLMGEVESTKLYLHFKRTNSEITGEASTAKAGVGGRGSAMFVDEYPEIERGQEVREKTALTANSRFFVGTHLGAGTPFDRMCDHRISPEVVRQRLHWTDGPPEQKAGAYRADPERPTIPEVLDKSYPFPPDFAFVLDGTPTGGHAPGVRSPWYDRKCAEIGDSRAVAQNLDIDVAGSAKQFFDPAVVHRLIAEARPPVWEGEVDCDRQGTFLGVHQEKGGRLRLWERFDGFGKLPAARYCAGADVAAGTGATNSCFAAIDGDRSLKVLEWADPRTDEGKFAAVCVALCRWLKSPEGTGAFFGWDSSGQQGVKFTRAVTEIGYGNIYFNESDLVKYSTGRAERKPGWYGSNDQRYAALKDYRNAIFARTLADRSERCLRETLRFEYEKRTGVVQHAEEERANDPTGARKNHGDMVIATAIAWMLAKDMAAGGRREKPARSGPEPMSIEWMEALAEGHRRLMEEVY